MAAVDILLPTHNRLSSLIMTLSGVALQTLHDIHVIIADQSQQSVEHEPALQALFRVIAARGGRVSYHYRPPLHGIAEQRDFLLRQATSDAILYLDDDVLMESWVLARLLTVLQQQQCAFVGAFPAGLSYRGDVRPHQQHIEYWQEHVHPEYIDPDSPQWQRNTLHRAANIYHVAQSLPAGTTPIYKVAWSASCVLYDREKVLALGGFSFWSRLPRYHSGEEVLLQNLLLRRWGGCNILPSGTYSSEFPTTVLNAQNSIDGHALDLLPEMLARYGLQTPGEALPEKL